jgi:GNAT superfamily N-acetyltransferase
MSKKSVKDEKTSHRIEIIDATSDPKYEQYLYWCVMHRRAKWIPMEERPGYENFFRYKYLKDAVPKGFHFKVLFEDGDYVAMIEYAPAEVSGYPITGKGVIVMNCLWVLRPFRGQGYARVLVHEMINGEKNASGFATIGLEKHWKVWLKKEQMEGLGFKSVRSIELEHKIRHQGQRFKVHLMWMPAKDGAAPPTWDEKKLLEGYYVCGSHPLGHYWYDNRDMKEIYKT